jgi:diguanylate cyclase (GGDEF)-like protein
MADTDAARDRPPELDDRLPLLRRGIFDRQLRDLVAEAIAAGTPLSLAMIDLDRFKLVNVRHGHLIGDEVLLQAAAIVAGGAAQKETCYRYGGEEFTVLLPNYCSEEALAFAERVRRDLESTRLSSKPLSVTASFGVVSLPEHTEDGDTLLKKADEAVYQAKKLGRNYVHMRGEALPTAPEPRVVQFATSSSSCVGITRLVW